ncbi:hypothetical protein JYT86_00805, partial [bacterium AH-315-N03]|nr:hypothetical protein [bacterium AH-315-N03]
MDALLRRWTWLLAMLVGGSACDVAIYGRIDSDGDSVRITEGEGWIGSVSVGLLDDMTLVEWVRTDGDDSIPTVRWFDERLQPTGDEVPLGLGAAWASRFVRHQDALVAQVWASPPGEPWQLEDAAYWFFPLPPGRAERRPIELDVVREELPFSVLHVGAAGFGVGPEGKLSIAASAGQLLATLGATPAACGRDGFRQIHLASNDPPVGRPLNPSLCDASVPETGNGWVFAIGDGTFGLLYRQRPADDVRIRYLRLDAGGRPLGDPVLVGLDLYETFSSIDGGFQPRALVVGNHVLFTERYGGTNTCHVLRVMNLDGSDARDAPWQLPCRGYALDQFEPERRVTPSIELLRIEDGALLVYAEHTYAGPVPITRSYPWTEAIHAVLLDGDGRRGSDILTV